MKGGGGHRIESSTTPLVSDETELPKKPLVGGNAITNIPGSLGMLDEVFLNLPGALYFEIRPGFSSNEVISGDLRLDSCDLFHRLKKRLRRSRVLFLQELGWLNAV